MPNLRLRVTIRRRQATAALPFHCDLRKREDMGAVVHRNKHCFGSDGASSPNFSSNFSDACTAERIHLVS
jgi:hypothetical protein